MDIHENKFGLKDSKFSSYEILQNYIESKKIDSNWMTDKEIQYLNENVYFVELHIPS